MGRAARWFKGLLGLKRSDPTTSPSPSTAPSDSKPAPSKEKPRRWSFVRSYREKPSQSNARRFSDGTPRPHLHVPDSTAPTTTATANASYVDSENANKHAIAVAAATAAVAEAAVAAAQAAAAVVRLTSSGRCTSSTPPFTTGKEARAAVVIQSHFRGYLARRALRALKGLVKLQALVRGHIMRKKTAETMRCMQAMLRAQVRARAGRAYVPESPYSLSKSAHTHQPGPATPEKFEQAIGFKNVKHDCSAMLRRNGSRSNSRIIVNKERGYHSSSWSDPRMDEPFWDHQGPSMSAEDDRIDKILEVDTGKPQFNPRRKNLFESPRSGFVASDRITHSCATSKDSTAHSCEGQPLNPLKLSRESHDDASYCTAENSPQFYSASSRGGSSRRGPFTPTKSDGSTSVLSGYSDCPSYMAYTESAKAKVRSVSAPKQRPHYERTSSTKRHSVHGLGDSRFSVQRVSAMQASFASKAYPGSGRLDRYGMPVGDSLIGYHSGYLS